MPAPVLLRHPSSLHHDTGPHPERAARIVAIERELEAAAWHGFACRESPAAQRAVLHAVHPESHVAAIEDLVAAGGGAIDMDTVTSPGSWDAALHAAGGAAALADDLMSGAARCGASLHRPPGHHAEAARAMGFCLFNNVAIAARRARDEHGARRVLILDWDVHHGNGTEAIFAATDEVLFVSIHEWPLYPGTGAVGETGSGAGDGFTVNLPVPAGSGDETFCSLVEHVVVPLARRYEPALVLVSAGYDAHADDPLASCRVTDDGYAAMTASVRALCDDLEVGLGFVLEGGYDTAALARSVSRTLQVAGSDSPPVPPDVGLHPLAAGARARLGL